MARNDITEDAILGGRLRIRQPARGYRVNVDTLAARRRGRGAAGARLMEAGLRRRRGAARGAARAETHGLLGIERDANMAALARENVALNAMTRAWKSCTGDALERSMRTGACSTACSSTRRSTQKAKAARPREARRARAYRRGADRSHGSRRLPIGSRGGAALTLIHRAAKLPEILAALEGRLGGLELIPIHPRAGEPAKRILVRARKGSRAPLRLLPGLELHDDAPAPNTRRKSRRFCAARR